MRAILIDPYTRAISEISLPAPHSYREIKAALGIESPVTHADLGGGVDMWVDDEGLLIEGGEQRFFAIRPRHHVGPSALFAGKGLILGLDRETGETVAAPELITVELLEGDVFWLGDEWDVEAQIERGVVQRPENSMTYTDENGQQVTETLWRWQASRREDAAPAA